MTKKENKKEKILPPDFLDLPRSPVGRCRCIPVPIEIKREKPQEVLKKAIEGLNEL